MKRLFLFALAVCLLCARVEAQSPQTVTLHGAPQGVTSCTIPAQFTAHTIGTGLCPALSFQTHWKPGGGSPRVDPANTLVSNLAHVPHIECNTPHLGEIGGPVTLPCRFQLFHTAGTLALITDLGQASALTMDPSTPTQSNAFPVVGDPNGVVIANFHMTVDPRQQMRRDDPSAKIIQDHGWANFTLIARVYLDNGDTVDSHMNWTFWSMVHPSTPPLPEGEGTRRLLGTMSTAVSARDEAVGAWGAHWIEFRDTPLPLWAAFSAPLAVDAFGYTYNTSAPFLTEYHLVCDNDYHQGIVGTEMTFVTARTPVSGEPFNHDFLDPLQLSRSQAPAGFPLGVHRCTAIWQEGTPDTQSIPNTPSTATIAAGQTLVSLLSFDVAIGSNPEGCNATCSNAIGASPVVPPPVVVVPPPTPVCTPPAVLQGNACVTPVVPPPPPAPTFLGVTAVCAVERFSDGSTKNRCLDVP
jgi:hypothetical protein